MIHIHISFLQLIKHEAPKNIVTALANNGYPQRMKSGLISPATRISKGFMVFNWVVEGSDFRHSTFGLLLAGLNPGIQFTIFEDGAEIELF